MPFRDLPLAAVLCRNLDRLGYLEPTAIQAQLIAPALEGRDVLGIARTGSGKTAAFVLPVAESILRLGVTGRNKRAAHTRTPRAVVLCPTRELALQVAEEATQLLSGSQVVVFCVHGKVSLGPQQRALAEGVDLLVATPGRCRELLESSALDLSRVRHVVLDEADRMLDLGFEPQVRAIIDATPSDRQSLLLSATMPEAVARLAEDFLRHPIRIDADPANVAVAHVEQRLVTIDDALKVPLLLALLAGALPPAAAATEVGPDDQAEPVPPPERQGVLVFCRTRRRAHWVGTALLRHGIKVGYLHGDRSHAQRQRALAAFSASKLRVLVATDVAARGLHVPAVQTVINYDIAIAPEEHIHRVGRAAHGLEGRGGSGQAITMLADEDRGHWGDITKLTGRLIHPERSPALGAFLEGAPARARATESRGQGRDDTASEGGGATAELARERTSERGERSAPARDSKRTTSRNASPGRAGEETPIFKRRGDGKDPARANKPRRDKSPFGGRDHKAKSRPIKKGEKPGGGVKPGTRAKPSG